MREAGETRSPHALPLPSLSMKRTSNGDFKRTSLSLLVMTTGRQETAIERAGSNPSLQPAAAAAASAGPTDRVSWSVMECHGVS